VREPNGCDWFLAGITPLLAFPSTTATRRPSSIA
jgi:hypothetical protein